MNHPVATHLHIHGGGEGVNDGDADAVQTARDLVAVAAKFAARMKDGEHNLNGGHAALVHVDGDAAPVVCDGDAVVPVDDDLDGVAVTRECLIDGVVHDLIDEVMQSALRCRADIHTGTLAHRLQSFEDLNLPRAVVGIDGGHLIAHLLGGDGDAREVGYVRHFGGFLCLCLRERANLRLLFVCIQVDILCHYVLLGGRLNYLGSTDKFSTAILAYLFRPLCALESST